MEVYVFFALAALLLDAVFVLLPYAALVAVVNLLHRRFKGSFFRWLHPLVVAAFFVLLVAGSVLFFKSLLAAPNPFVPH